MKRMRYLLATLVALAGCLVAVSPVSAAPPPGVPSAAPSFKAPFPCGQSWTYSHHGSEVRLALDFIDNAGNTNGAPALASAPGTAYQHSQPSGAGSWISIDHGGGWLTYYFHLQSFSVANGAAVAQGQEIGKVGSSGNSSGPHLHYEQLYNGGGQTVHINGQSLAPYPGSYGQKSITSDNACGGPGKPFQTWGSGIRVRSDAFLSSPVVTTLPGPTGVYVLCQKQGDVVNAEGYTNDWWAKLRDQNGFISNIYIDTPEAVLPGVPTC
ncbi:MAG: peptidoglycan DD-metalloendopeptidase family protein [Streptosporangiales bacterium]|nr:peptidoglycan DD-metalloendopeptidase family protein [Streptosporangiales bacterium]